MEKELQNKVWEILPEEFKNKVKAKYDNYGIIGNVLKDNQSHITRSILKELFGEHNLISNKILSKFKIGDKVFISDVPHIEKDFRGRIGTIEFINSENQYTVYIDNKIFSCFNGAFLTPLSELKFKWGDKVIVIKGDLKGECGIVVNIIGSNGKFYADVNIPGYGTYTIDFNELELYAEPQLNNVPESKNTKDNQLYITVASSLLSGILSRPNGLSIISDNRSHVLNEIFDLTNTIIKEYER